MKKIKFIAFLAVLTFMLSISQSYAFAVTGDSSTETDQDSTVSSSVSAQVSQDAVAGVNSSVSGQIAQDATAGVRANVSSDVDQDALVQAIQNGVSNPSTESNQDGQAGVVSNHSTESDQDGQAGVISNTSTELDQDSGTQTPPVTPENPGGGGGTPEVVNRSSGSGGSGSFSGSGSRPTNLPAVVTITSCPLITDYLKFGAINDGVQVARLQAFLKNAEKLNVDVTGIFDQKTEDAVKAFQLKYLPTILGPWDATKATGFVYITTKKQLNALACASPLTLSADDQTIIDAYKARGTAAPAESSVEGGTETTTPSETPTVEVGTVGTSTSENVAAVGEASVLSRFLNYIKNLFR